MFILCGGPDWPVSVLTGILGLDVMQMLLGSVPVVFLIAPCVCAGAFLLRVPESGTWQSLASLALAGAGATQIFAMLAAGYYIEQVATKRREQLMKLEDDLEVKVAEQQAAQKKVYRAMLANWHRPGFPLTIRLILVLGAVSTMAACYIVQFAADQAFLPFEVTSSIDAPVPEGLGGSVSNLIVEPLGTHAVQALAVGCVCLILYSRWLSSPCIRAQCCCVEPDVESDQQTLASSIASDALKDTPGDTADAEAGAALDTKKLTESSRNQEFAL